MRYDPETTTCPSCGTPFTPTGRQRWCSNACRQAAWRRRQPAPPTSTQPDPERRRVPTVYQCPDCDQRFIDIQRCDDCNTFCRKLGHGGTCPHCDELLTLQELLVGWA